MTLEDSTTYQWILNQGLAKGLEQGLEQGLAKGVAKGLGQGKLEEAKRLLINMGTRRLGALTAEQRAAVDQLTDLAKLEQLIEAIFTTNDWASLLG